jgi:hypothetical protein
MEDKSHSKVLGQAHINHRHFNSKDGSQVLTHYFPQYQQGRIKVQDKDLPN